MLLAYKILSQFLINNKLNIKNREWNENEQRKRFQSYYNIKLSFLIKFTFTFTK